MVLCLAVAIPPMLPPFSTSDRYVVGPLAIDRSSFAVGANQTFGILVPGARLLPPPPSIVVSGANRGCPTCPDVARDVRRWWFYLALAKESELLRWFESGWPTQLG